MSNSDSIEDQLLKAMRATVDSDDCDQSEAEEDVSSGVDQTQPDCNESKSSLKFRELIEFIGKSEPKEYGIIDLTRFITKNETEITALLMEHPDTPPGTYLVHRKNGLIKTVFVPGECSTELGIASDAFSGLTTFDFTLGVRRFNQSTPIGGKIFLVDSCSYVLLFDRLNASIDIEYINERYKFTGLVSADTPPGDYLIFLKKGTRVTNMAFSMTVEAPTTEIATSSKDPTIYFEWGKKLVPFAQVERRFELKKWQRAMLGSKCQRCAITGIRRIDIDPKIRILIDYDSAPGASLVWSIGEVVDADGIPISTLRMKLFNPGQPERNYLLYIDERLYEVVYCASSKEIRVIPTREDVHSWYTEERWCHLGANYTHQPLWFVPSNPLPRYLAS
jgi:hypothetical protein